MYGQIENSNFVKFEIQYSSIIGSDMLLQAPLIHEKDISKKKLHNP